MFSFFRDFDRSFFPMTQTSSFSALGISPEILEAIEVLGFDTPSSIQEQAIPAAISGADIVGLSHTGSGKTLAFAIPALECIEPEERCVQVLALCPTRELAVQICREVDKLALFMDGRFRRPHLRGGFFPSATGRPAPRGAVCGGDARTRHGSDGVGGIKAGRTPHADSG